MLSKPTNHSGTDPPYSVFKSFISYVHFSIEVEEDGAFEFKELLFDLENELKSEFLSEFFSHFALKVMSSVIEVIKSKRLSFNIQY